MRGAIEAALLLAAGLAVAECAICKPGHTWWSPQLESCLNCTRCDAGERALVVLRPCHVHQDTVCGEFSQLGIDWSWLRSHNEHRHAKRRKEPDRRVVWRFPPSQDNELEFAEALEATLDKAETEDAGYDEDYDVEVQFDSEPLSGGDLVWDWQTVVLLLAIATCLLFFLVVAVYAVYYVRQWKTFKQKWDAESVSDVEGLSAKLSLMLASLEASHFAETAPPPGAENQYSNLRCSYLEQLLAGKSKGRPLGPNNFYIQESNNY